NAGQWVLAGTYLQTDTRVTSMESANESARHAVNALLEHVLDFHGDLCPTWDPERYEIADAARLKELDEELFHADVPHMADVLDLEKLPDRLFATHPEEPLARVFRRERKKDRER